MVEASRFNTFGNATVDGTGTATVTFQATAYKWQIDQITVRQTSFLTGKTAPVLESTCTVYRNLVSPANIVDITYTGSSGDRTSDDCYLEQGESLIVQWTGADVTTTMSCTISGWQSVPDRGFRAVH